MFSIRLLLAIAALMLAACGIESVDQEMIGDWRVPVSELPERIGAGLDGDIELLIAIEGPNSSPGYAGRVSTGAGCSSYGGIVSSFEPLEFPMVSIAGVGGCVDRDRVADEVITQIQGTNLRLVDGKLAIVLDGQQVLLTKLR